MKAIESLDPDALSRWLRLARERHALVSSAVGPFVIGVLDGRVYIRLILGEPGDHVTQCLTYGFIDSRDGAVYRAGQGRPVRPIGEPVGNVFEAFEPRSIGLFGLVAERHRPSALGC